MLSKALIALMLPGALLCSCSDDNDDDQPKAPVTEPEFTVPANATDLSAEGTANCYILAPGTSGAFNAKYKGNSTTLEIGPAAGATLLWQTKPGLITYLNFDDSVLEQQTQRKAVKRDQFLRTDTRSYFAYQRHVFV